MTNKLNEYITAMGLFSPKDPILLAVSGGVDSTVMVHLFKKSGFRFGIAHLNFQLRENDAAADELFVKNLSAENDVPYFTTVADTVQYSKEHRISIQMAAREIRYNWLEEIRLKNNFHFIATAHHQDDVIETVLLNIFRGTGIHGLHGIASKHGKIIRPLLPFFKNELIDYATDNEISFKEDISNSKPGYDRNKIRLEIIPFIEQTYPAFAKTFSENVSKWNDADLLYSTYIKQLKRKLVQISKDGHFISIPAICRLPGAKTILYELIKDYGFSSDQSAQVYKAFGAISGKVFTSLTHQLIKDRNQLILSSLASTDVSTKLITESDRHLQLGSVKFKLAVHDANSFMIPNDPSINCLNYDLLAFPLVLRKWKRGDYFYPLGMKKKKKVSDYLIDSKIPLAGKEKIWILQSGDNIACIMGERIDDRFKVTSGTKKIYVIS